MQSVWKGAISFGLVSIPVQLFTATEERGVPLHQVHAKDGGRVRYRRVCSVAGEEVPYSDIARGYELPNGEVVVLTDEDFAGLPLSSSRAIQVLSFVDAGSIDPVQLSRCYHCEPTDSDAKPYVLLRDALERAEKVAMVKIALRQRESLAVLRPRDSGLVLQLMLWPDEVREPRLSFLDDVRLRPQEVQMAAAYVQALTGEVDPDQLVDRYRVALDQLIEAKVAGREVAQPPAPTQVGGADLMEALRRSVEAAKRSRGEAAQARKPPAKNAKAKSVPQKKTARSTTGPPQQATARKKTAAKKTATKTPATKKTTAPRGARS
jgi:DNA end-binding protein Ku